MMHRGRRWWLPLVTLGACTVLCGCTMSPQQIGEWCYLLAGACGTIGGLLGARVRHLDVCERCLKDQQKRKPGRTRKVKLQGARLPGMEEGAK